MVLASSSAIADPAFFELLRIVKIYFVNDYTRCRECLKNREEIEALRHDAHCVGCAVIRAQLNYRHATGKRRSPYPVEIGSCMRSRAAGDTT